VPNRLDAERAIEGMRKIYADRPNVRLQLAGPSRPFEYADPKTHDEIRWFLNAELPGAPASPPELPIQAEPLRECAPRFRLGLLRR
jgi:hypothetical protein